MITLASRISTLVIYAIMGWKPGPTPAETRLVELIGWDIDNRPIIRNRLVTRCLPAPTKTYRAAFAA